MIDEKEVTNVNIKTKGIILTLLVIGTLVTALATTQVDAYANETASQEQNRHQHQYRHRLTIQECACQTTGDDNELNGDCEQLKWQHQTRMRNTNQTSPQTQLRERANHGGE
jgi:Ni/Co efflux regulator RcnB